MERCEASDARSEGPWPLSLGVDGVKMWAWAKRFLCSRNARPEKDSLDARSGRLISLHPWRDNERAWRDHLQPRSTGAVGDHLARPQGRWQMDEKRAHSRGNQTARPTARRDETSNRARCVDKCLSTRKNRVSVIKYRGLASLVLFNPFTDLSVQRKRWSVIYVSLSSH